MHRHEYAIQMGFTMMNDNALIKADKLWFHLAPDAGPEDTLALLRTLYANPNARFATMKQLCTAATEEYNAGKRSRDSLQVVQLINLISNKPIRLTELGLGIVTAASRLQVDLLHYLLYTGWDEQQPTLRGPLCTYRQVCDILWNGSAERLNHQHLLHGVRQALDARFADLPEYQRLHLSLSGKSMRGVTLWLERLCPSPIADGQFALRDACPSELLLLALGWVYHDQLSIDQLSIAPRSRDMKLNLDASHREALCRLCLLQPSALDPMLDQTLDRHRQYITDSGRGAGGSRIITMHRLPSLADAALRGRGYSE